MKEIKAIDKFGTPYMTQSAEVELEQRLYISAISGLVVSPSDWRGATAEEKAEWQVEMDAKYPSPGIDESNNSK